MEADAHTTIGQGATAAQARAALKRYKDVMQAAERIFDGAFDDIVDDGDVNMAEAGSSKAASSGLAVRQWDRRALRVFTPCNVLTRITDTGR